MQHVFFHRSSVSLTVRLDFIVTFHWTNIESSGGSRISRWRGHRLPTRTLFGKNVCENKRNGSCWGGGRAGGAPGYNVQPS